MYQHLLDVSGQHEVCCVQSCDPTDRDVSGGQATKLNQLCGNMNSKPGLERK